MNEPQLNKDATTRTVQLDRQNTLSVSQSVLVVLVVAWATSLGVKLNAQTLDSQAKPAAGCILEDRFFEEEVWAKVGERTCLKCHHSEGDAAESKFLLTDPGNSREGDREWLRQNRQAFENMAMAKEDDRSRLLLKAGGGLDHEGGEVLKRDSVGYKILERFVARLERKDAVAIPEDVTDDYAAPPFFDGINMASPQRLLRRVTLSLAGRLPTNEELAAVEQGGQPAMNSILDAIMKEEAFYTRLKEGFNDIFLTVGIEDNAVTLLS